MNYCKNQNKCVKKNLVVISKIGGRETRNILYLLHFSKVLSKTYDAGYWMKTFTPKGVLPVIAGNNPA